MPCSTRRLSSSGRARRRTVEASDNEVTILAADGAERHVPRSSKEQVAHAVLDEVERLRASERGGELDGAGRARSRAGAGA